MPLNPAVARLLAMLTSGTGPSPAGAAAPQSEASIPGPGRSPDYGRDVNLPAAPAGIDRATLDAKIADLTKKGYPIQQAVAIVYGKGQP